MAIIHLQKYNMYLALAIHLAGFLAALVTGKHLYGYRLFPIIKNLLGTLTCINILTNGVSIIGSILLLNFGQSLSTCTLAIYNMSVAPLTSTVLMACLAIDRFYMTKETETVGNVPPKPCSQKQHHVWRCPETLGRKQTSCLETPRGRTRKGNSQRYC